MSDIRSDIVMTRVVLNYDFLLNNNACRVITMAPKENYITVVCGRSSPGIRPDVCPRVAWTRLHLPQCQNIKCYIHNIGSNNLCMYH